MPYPTTHVALRHPRVRSRKKYGLTFVWRQLLAFFAPNARFAIVPQGEILGVVAPLEQRIFANRGGS